MDAHELLDGYRAGTLSPVEALESALARIESANPAVNAFRLVDADAAQAAAEASQERWRRGAPRGLLDGVPVAIKDVFPTRGWPTLRGSLTVAADRDWPDDAPAVAALRRHGAVLVGKTTTPEFGWKGITDSALDGVTRNPWDVTRTSGGSSGGSAVALASGMVALALGSDGGGSIRIPCGFCGLPGIKPTFGRAPAWPPSVFGILSHVGPMGRTVPDVALLLDVMCEPDARDWAALEPPPQPFRDTLSQGIRGLRIAFSPDLGHVRVDPEVAALVERAAARLEALGAHVEAIDPGFEDPRPAFDALWSAGAAKQRAALSDTGRVDPGFLRWAERGQALTVLEYLHALDRRDALGRRMAAFHGAWDLLITPTLPIPAFQAGRDTPDGEGEWPDWTPFTYPFNLTQQPAGTVPCGFTAAGLPAGLQIVGPRYGDATVLRAMHAYASAHPEPAVASG
ncbi:amidase [Candidatus Solirubrobacter pratensis]|uniref:amidase n=1 Tax=Candidatus Solirubrobacter pratensis TaxID=1298857 RepID=UPI0004149393|nr:amidase [Candidatus Solirubrobacter pratensis]